MYTQTSVWYIENRPWGDKVDEALLEEKNQTEHHALLMAQKRLLGGCSGISLVFLCKDGLPRLTDWRVQLGWAVTSVKPGVHSVTFCEMFPSLCYLFQTFLLGRCIMTSKRARQHASIWLGIILAENICNGFHQEKKLYNWYLGRKKPLLWPC